jgi:hypothetical protein
LGTNHNGQTDKTDISAEKVSFIRSQGGVGAAGRFSASIERVKGKEGGLTQSFRLPPDRLLEKFSQFALHSSAANRRYSQIRGHFWLLLIDMN